MNNHYSLVFIFVHANYIRCENLDGKLNNVLLVRKYDNNLPTISNQP